MRTLFVFIASSLTLNFVNAAELPFRAATPAEVAALTQPDVIATPLNQTNFNTAATVTVQKLSGTPVSSTRRASNALSAVYKAAISAGTDPNPHVVPPSVQPPDFIVYEDNHDSVQTWATMSELGAPFVMVYADGQSHGQSASSWSTRYIVPGTGNRDVYAQFTIPAIRFEGRYEDAARSQSWARMRIDFLVDAYPAWSTESFRFNEIVVHFDPITQITTYTEQVHIDTFGASLGLDATHPYTASQTITVKLGTYPAGKPLDLTLLFQGEGKLDSPCGPDGGETVCGGVSMKIDWDPSAPQPVLFSQPAP